MTASWNTMTGEDRALVAATFQALTARDGLRDRGRNEIGAEQTCGFADLYAYANDPRLAMPDDLAAALQAEPRLARDLERLLAKTCRFHAPRLAAASSGQLRHREGPGFTLDIRTSRAEASQVFVVIRLTQNDAPPEALFVAQRGSEFLKQPLPRMSGDTLQLLFEADATIVHALQDPQSEVFLR